MVKRPKDKKQEEPQEAGFSFDMGAVGQGAIGQGALGEASQEKLTTSGLRYTGTGAYEVETYYNSPLDFERSKYGDIKRTRQLLLGEGVDLAEVDSKIAEYQPDWGITENRVLDAISRLINKQYRREEDGLEVVFSPQEFYDLCGLKKNSKGKRSRKLEKEYLETLRSLSSTPQKIIQTQTRYVQDKKGRPSLKYDTYILKAPILQLMEADVIESDTREEAQEVMEKAISGQELGQKKRRTRYKVRPDPIMYRLLDKLYVRKSITQYEEIQALHPGEKLKESTQAFLNYVQSLDFSKLEIGRDTLAERMKLYTYIQQRKRTLINSRIDEALEDALRTRYILRYHEEPTGLLIIYLNPEKCSRLQAKLDRAKKEEV